MFSDDQDAVDEVCRRVPQALRQLILDYYVMGMRPKEILTHVGDLSWSDLQERDRLWLRLATTNAHQGAEPQASQLKAKAPLPSKSAGDASSDTEDQVPSTPGEMQCAESVSQSGLSNGFAPILQLILLALATLLAVINLWGYK